MSTDVERILILHSQRFSASEISREVGCSTRTVIRVRKRHGLAVIRPDGDSAPISTERLDMARAMFADGASQAEVARTMHMSKMSLNTHFPGRVWSQEQKNEYLSFAFKFREIERAPDLLQERKWAA